MGLSTTYARGVVSGRELHEPGERRGERPIRLRDEGACARCRSLLPKGERGWWDHRSRELVCLTCVPDPRAPLLPPSPPRVASSSVVADDPAQRATSPPVPEVIAPAVLADPAQGADDREAGVPPQPEPSPGPAPLTSEERGTPGASARAEGVRRSKKREATVRAKHPKIGGLILAMREDPSHVKVWEQGAVGEERVGAFLEQARPQGIEVLHDRRVPRSRANIDHLVVAPTGIWVVDPKRYLSGKVAKRDVGGWFKTDHRLYVGSRDQTKLVAAMLRQVDLVTRAMAGTPFAHVPVHGALCFVDAQLGVFAKPFVLEGVHITWRKKLLAPMLAPCPAPLDEAQRAAVARHLADHFRPA